MSLKMLKNCLVLWKVNVINFLKFNMYITAYVAKILSEFQDLRVLTIWKIINLISTEINKKKKNTSKSYQSLIIKYLKRYMTSSYKNMA